jgi:hypothetical protein
VSENRILRNIFGPKRSEVTGEWGRLHNEEVTDLYSSSNVIRVIKLRRIRGVGLVALMGRREVHTGFRWGNLRERDHFEDPGVNWRIILKWISGSGMWEYGLD